VASVLLGVAAWGHPDLEEQIADVNLRIEQQPGDASLWVQRGELYRLHREWDRAEADFRQARKLDPGLQAVDFLIGRMYLEAGRPAEAKVLLDRFLAVEPDHATARIERARALVELKQPLAAAQDYTEALGDLGERGRPIPAHYLERAHALVSAGPAHVPEALRGLDEGLERLGQPVSLQLYAIELELARGSHAGALARLDRIASQAKRQETWLVRRGEILESAGKPAEARAAYRSALAAIESLPVSRKGTRAVTELQGKAEAALGRLGTDE
jgi:predicted Zn-dependent protease